MTQNTLITGGTGFVGSALIKRLRRSGVEPLAPKRNELDLSDTLAVEAFVRSNDITTVVHLAASLDRRPDQEAQASQWQDTFELGRSVITAASRGGVRTILATGSMDEVGRASGVVVNDTEVSPTNTYGLCKALLLEVAKYEALRSDMGIEWIRPTAIYGPGQSGPMLVPAAFQTAFASNSADFTSGEQIRNFIYIDDLVDWMSLALEVPHERGVRIHHLGADAVAVRDVLSEIATLTGAQFNLGAIPRRPNEPDLVTVPEFKDERSPLDIWKPQVDMKDGLSKTYQWWKSLNVGSS